jgi:hypothetical protein
MKLIHDLCLSWNWEHDAPFVALLDSTFRESGRSLFQVTASTLERDLADLAAGRVGFRAYLDRSSESDPRFLALDEWVREGAAASVNAHALAARATDKSAMHRALFSVVRTPYTMVLAPHAAQPVLDPLDLAPLGPCFSIKPAHGGGGDGVVVEAHTLGEVLAARRQYPADEYLLQTHVVPAAPDGRVAWFRVLYCAGEVYPCWWDPVSHVYAQVTAAEEVRLGLGGLREVAATVARVCGLRLFSTEIALLPDGALVVVDYVNDPIDLRLQSLCKEGVPDAVARLVAARLLAFATGALT